MNHINTLRHILCKWMCIFLTAVILITMIPLTETAVSATTYDSAVGTSTTYYIKNMFSGKYLDVKNGAVANGTNVIQYHYNGSSNQRWKLVHKGSGIYEIVSAINSNYVLDVSGGKTTDGTNITIWKRNNGKGQRFNVARTSNGTYKILTQNTSYKRGMVVQNSSCANGANVFQWGYSNNAQTNDEWMLEPATTKSKTLGANYAEANYKKRPLAFANINGLGGDCANFVSQILMASGFHEDGRWYMKKKNKNYPSPSNVTQLNNSWTLASPSPWISAKEFNSFWSKKRKTKTYSSAEVRNNPAKILAEFGPGDVVQWVSSILGEGKHTMYITANSTLNGVRSLALTYHSSNTLNENLVNMAKKYPNYKYKFFDFTP